MYHSENTNGEKPVISVCNTSSKKVSKLLKVISKDYLPN